MSSPLVDHDHRDPGWKPALRKLLKAVVLQLARKATVDHPLTGIRVVYLSLIPQGLLVGGLLTFLLGFSADAEAWIWAIVVAATVLAFGAARWFHRRMLGGDTPLSVLRSYRTTTEVACALAMAPVLIAFVLAFMSESLAVYWVAVALSIPAFVETAPSHRDVMKRQTEVAERGIDLLSV